MTPETLSYSVSNILQGQHKFYTLSMPSDVLARSCFVTTREEDPDQGFQRELSKKRAQDIADYIDNGLGTIPTSIILSAQEMANLTYNNRNKTITFEQDPRAFLVLDGQHRVFGFQLCKTVLRVPVVIYDNLSRQDESRLFIDINSKQLGVPSELLLDIKKLASYENDSEALLRDLFDKLNNEPDSPLVQKLSASKKVKDKITRVTFNNSFRLIDKYIAGKNSDEIYTIFSNYFSVFMHGFDKRGLGDYLTGAVVFKAIVAFFPNIASRVKDRFGSDYTVLNFESVTSEFFTRIKPNSVSDSGNSYQKLLKHFEDCMKREFSL